MSAVMRLRGVWVSWSICGVRMLRYTAKFMAICTLAAMATTGVRAQVHPALLEDHLLTAWPQVHEVPGLLEDLRDKDTAKRSEAACLLGYKMDVTAVKPLIAALKDIDVAVRRAAAESLGMIGDASAVPVLIETLGNRADQPVRVEVAAALGRIKDPRALEPLSRVLADAQEERAMRSAAITGLARLRTPAATAPLLAALNDSDETIRKDAVQALSEVPDPAAVPGIIAALKDNSIRVKLEAMHTLRIRQEKKAADTLLALLKDANETPWVRTQASALIGELRDTRVVEPLIMLLATRDDVARNAAGRQISVLLEYYGRPEYQLTDPAAEDVLIAALKDNNTEIMESAAIALGFSKSDKAVVALLDALKDERARKKAIASLGRMKDQRAVAALITLLPTKDYSTGDAAVEALGRIGGPNAMAALKEIGEKGGSGYQRDKAKKWLEKLK